MPAGAADADHAHPGGARGAGDRPADVTETDNRERLSLDPLGKDVTDPPALAVRLEIRRHALRDAERPGEDVLRHPRAEDPGRARDRDVCGYLRHERPVDPGAHDL